MQKFKILSTSEVKEMLSSLKVIPKSIKIFFPGQQTNICTNHNY